MKEKIKGNNYIYWGITAFCVLAACVLLVFILVNLSSIFSVIVKIVNILTPIFLGMLFAYLLNPLVKMAENYTIKFVDWLDSKTKKKLKKKKKLARGLSIFLVYLISLLFIVLVLMFVLPSLVESLNTMLTNIPTYISNVYDYLKKLAKSNPELLNLVDMLNNNITTFIGSLMIPSMDTIITNITTGISSVIKWIFNVIIGIIVSIYLIFDREHFLHDCNKLLKAVLPNKVYDTSLTTLGYIDKVFGGFMGAKILDSIIIGIITFIVSTLFRIPYSLVIALIVGVTNVIPYFGPFIGAIPCILFLLLIDPSKSLTFAILILLIQQFDGNILGPKLIGNKTGIKSFWVLFSILLFGGLFGFVGMIFGVPIFAVIYSVIANQINKRLAKKNSV